MTQWVFDPGTIDFKVGPFTVAQIPWYSRGSYMQFIELAQPWARGENILPPGQSGTLLVDSQGHLVADPHFLTIRSSSPGTGSTSRCRFTICR